MKRNTIKWKIFKYNLVLIIMLITFVTVIFNFAIRVYFEKDIVGQLHKISSRTEDTALRRGPGFFPDRRRMPPPEGKERMGPEIPLNDQNTQKDFEIFRFYLELDRSLREPLSVLNADYLLLDKDKNRIVSIPEEIYTPSADLLKLISDEIGKLPEGTGEKYFNFHLSGTEYTAIIKPVSTENSFGLSWIIIYSSLQKVNQLQWVINIILFAILAFSALITVVFSSLLAKKISAPFITLNQHISAIAERNFGTKITVPVVDELNELVDNINIMSEKLETYDKAQKTFLQNASHEFRTPLMSIQSYAEGIKYNVVDQNSAADIIIDESKRMTHLVEDLLYLSRLDAIEESYHFENLELNELINVCVDRMNGIAIKTGVGITANKPEKGISIYADGEKLSRTFMNIISNCIRYAESSVIINTELIGTDVVRIAIADDGPGFDAKELPNIFERFYKGKKGNFGLGLAISKNVIEKHNGKISAENREKGALYVIELPVNQCPLP